MSTIRPICKKIEIYLLIYLLQVSKSNNILYLPTIIPSSNNMIQLNTIRIPLADGNFSIVTCSGITKIIYTVRMPLAKPNPILNIIRLL